MWIHSVQNDFRTYDRGHGSLARDVNREEEKEEDEKTKEEEKAEEEKKAEEDEDEEKAEDEDEEIGKVFSVSKMIRCGEK